MNVAGGEQGKIVSTKARQLDKTMAIMIMTLIVKVMLKITITTIDISKMMMVVMLEKTLTIMLEMVMKMMLEMITTIMLKTIQTMLEMTMTMMLEMTTTIILEMTMRLMKTMTAKEHELT